MPCCTNGGYVWVKQPCLAQRQEPGDRGSGLRGITCWYRDSRAKDPGCWSHEMQLLERSWLVQTGPSPAAGSRQSSAMRNGRGSSLCPQLPSWYSFHKVVWPHRISCLLLQEDAGDLLLSWFVLAWQCRFVNRDGADLREQVTDGGWSWNSESSHGAAPARRLRASLLDTCKASCLLFEIKLACVFARPEPVARSNPSLLARQLGSVWISVVRCGPK